MNIKQLIISIIPQRLILFSRAFRSFWQTISKKNMRRKANIPILHLHLADHCNLNCRGCDNFSPLSPEIFPDFQAFTNDCEQISKICGDRIDEVQLLGGEPLLNKQIIDYLNVTRKFFPKIPIKIITNGILLPKMKSEFWESARQNDIEIVVTKYPINIDFQSLKQKVNDEKIRFSFYGNTEIVPKTMECVPLDLQGNQNARDSFLRCSRANRCVAVDNGKLYTCSLVPYVKYFNSFFGKNLEISQTDFLNIYEIKNMEQIVNYLCKPLKFCRFCNVKGTIYDIGYGVSKNNILEWTK
ncbi:MAG: 4Fe-4S cluster-binding domain-containing protein [Prevotellaceae bacterium]|jgi:MoaA/NifB/PqqE/SkfB family radical SAM enzyme|nr:4Fe-4S cluster-binding domain-containing protein [Prevotellaceae bacterium]